MATIKNFIVASVEDIREASPFLYHVISREIVGSAFGGLFGIIYENVKYTKLRENNSKFLSIDVFI